MNYNEAGIDYQILAQKIGSLPSGGMKASGMSVYVKLRDELFRAHRENTQDSNILKNVYGCMHHFETYLQQMIRFLSHVDAIDNISDMQMSTDYPVVLMMKKDDSTDLEAHGWDAIHPPLAIGLVARGVEYDFALLLLSAVATLDRISAFVSHQIFGKELNFYSLRLQIESSDDVRAKKIAGAIDKALPAIEHVLVTTDKTRKSLRNRLAHLSSFPEMLGGILTIHVLEDGRSIVFDHDLAGFPLFSTAYNIGGAMPYLSLAMMSAMFVFDAEGTPLPGAEELQELNVEDFSPEWFNPAVDRSLFTAPEGTGTAVTFFMPGIQSTRLDTVHLRDEIFAHARPSKRSI